jgi:hypothetical protein
VRRILTLATALAVVAALVSAVTAEAAPQLSSSKARTQAKAFVKKRAMSQNNANNPHGVPTNWGVVKAVDCDQAFANAVDCAYGIFWADGHQCFNIVRVKGTRNKKGAFVSFTFSRQFNRDACDDEGTTNGGSSAAGTATDIDPGGRGPLAPDDDEDEGPTGDDAP